MNVEVVQRRLWEQPKQHREHRESDTPLFPVNRYEGRVRNLMDLIHQPQWIAAACDRVLKRSRGKSFCQPDAGPSTGNPSDSVSDMPSGEDMCQVVKKNLESRMLGNLHVRFGVGAGVKLPGLHHWKYSGVTGHLG